MSKKKIKKLLKLQNLLEELLKQP